MIFYFLLVLFWIDVHPNILVLPFEIVAKLFADDYWTGWSYNLVNGNYSFSNNVPKTYFLINIRVIIKYKIVSKSRKLRNL